jgi:ribosomal protein S12 methylthiotransferase accessory factor YcaO
MSRKVSTTSAVPNTAISSAVTEASQGRRADIGITRWLTGDDDGIFELSSAAASQRQTTLSCALARRQGRAPTPANGGKHCGGQR